MARQSFAPAPVVGVDPALLARRHAEVINGVLNGKMNNVGDVTLTANAASTTVNSDAALVCTANSHVNLSPITANAAAALATTYVSSRTNGSFVITHANDAQVDKTFTYEVVG